MAGWTCPDKDLIEWDGTIRAKRVAGDGSLLTGIAATGSGHTIQDEGVPLTQRTNINFIGAGVTATDNLGADSTDVTINAGAADNLGDHIATQTVSGADIYMTGTASCAYFSGDGSLLYNLPAGAGETDPTFQAASAAYNSHLTASGAVHFTSNALWTSINAVVANAEETSAAYIAHAADATKHFVSDALWTSITSTSTAYVTHAASTAIHFTSDALWTSINANTTKLAVVSQAAYATSAAYVTHAASNALHFVSDALWASINKVVTNAEATSAAYLTHAADSSDPHGASLTQTFASIGSGAVTADMPTSGAAYIANALYATSSLGITASNYPIGTVLYVYTA